MAITKSDVLTAIEKLEQQGDTPTNANILAITGGSNATVQKYRSEIMAERQYQAVQSRIVLNDNDIKKLTATFNDLLAVRLGGVSNELTDIIKQLETTNRQLSADLDDTQEQLKHAKKQLASREATINELKNEVVFIQKNHAKEREELNEKLVEMYKQSGKIELLTERLATAEKENKELKYIIENSQAKTQFRP